MAIIGIAFGTGLQVFDFIANSHQNPRMVQAKLILQQVANQTKDQQIFYNDHITESNFVIEKTIEPYQNFKNCYLLKLTALDEKDQVLIEQNELIYLNK